MSDEALLRAIADACLGARAGEAMTADLADWLARHGVEAGDAAAILAAPRRLGVYRSLVRNGISAVVARMLPKTRARLNAACAGRFDADLAAFVDEVGPRTHYLRDVPAELVAWAEARWRADAGVPGYVADLARFELTHFAVASSPAAVRTEAVDLALDRGLALAESARMIDLSWTVHELPADEEATDAPARREVHLLAYRDAEHAVRWLELTPLAASVLRRLAGGESLGAAVERACADHGTPAAGPVLGDIARLLADLGARGVCLGGVPSPA
jgi:hypothetical protein